MKRVRRSNLHGVKPGQEAGLVDQTGVQPKGGDHLFLVSISGCIVGDCRRTLNVEIRVRACQVVVLGHGVGCEEIIVKDHAYGGRG